MTFTVEDGTGLEDANALVTVAFVDTFAEEMGRDAASLTDGWGNTNAGILDEDLVILKKKQAIIAASRWLSSAYQWINKPSTTNQALAWPQSIEPDAFAFPHAVKLAVSAAAIRIYQGINMAPDLARGGDIASEKVGPIAITYSDNASSETTYTEIDSYLRAYALSGSSTTFILTERL